jgi:hypothetical protein
VYGGYGRPKRLDNPVMLPRERAEVCGDDDWIRHW